MEPILIDNEWLAVTPPEGFAPLPHDELERLVGVRYSNMWGMRDPSRHMLFAITWKDSYGLLTKLVSEKSLAQRVDESFARRYRKAGYRNYGWCERTVSGASADGQGFRFGYAGEGVAQDGEVLVFKRGTRCYTLVYYTRANTAAGNQPVLEQALSSLTVHE